GRMVTAGDVATEGVVTGAGSRTCPGRSRGADDLGSDGEAPLVLVGRAYSDSLGTDGVEELGVLDGLSS
ncbi:MAG: hypothetical protein K2X47_07330, partial [Bdellovibrionales bacterium]|nr:hypothetical protein [Bdellovibrionales bacterium]